MNIDILIFIICSPGLTWLTTQFVMTTNKEKGIQKQLNKNFISRKYKLLRRQNDNKEPFQLHEFDQTFVVECPRMVTISSNLNINASLGDALDSDWKQKLGRFELTKYDQNGYPIYANQNDLLFHISGGWLVRSILKILAKYRA